jgi:transcriptional antiterminator RfaH
MDFWASKDDMENRTEYSPPKWYCLRSRLKHEHIAAMHLRQMEEIQVFSPRVRYRRATRLGPQWVKESLFPNYLFARFDRVRSQKQVMYCPGVAGIIHFGTELAVVPDDTIENLRIHVSDDGIVEFSDHIVVGDTVTLALPSFTGLTAVVTQVMPAKQRVRVLLEFLGQTREMEVAEKDVVGGGMHPISNRECAGVKTEVLPK